MSRLPSAPNSISRTDCVPRKAVLAVDSNPSVLRYLEQVLNEEGYRTLTASSVSEACALLDSETPDLYVI